MKLIKQSFEFINQTDFSLIGIKKHIERCARVSYKSEDKITDTSYEKFVNMLESRGHDRPLEFGTVHLKMESSKFQGFMQALYAEGMFNNIWIKSNYNEGVMYITTNYRYYLDITKRLLNIKEYFTEEDNEYYPKRYTVHMILDRGVMDEFRTHVGLSHLAESTRYCNYSKHKFGNEVTFIKPCWLNIPLGDYGIASLPGDNILWLTGGARIFVNSLLEAEDYYMTLLSEGWTPQQARSVLPLGIKSELISCGFKDAWENFMRRRSPKYGDPGAHPMAAEIADKLCEEFLKRGFIDEKKI
nr:MAG TPA: Thymidylate synthase complementing protein [Crassvirales sp.]